MVRDLYEVQDPGFGRPRSDADHGPESDLGDAQGRIVVGHHSLPDVVVLHDVDAGTSGNCKEAQQLTRHRREDEKLFGVQVVGVAAKCSIGGERQRGEAGGAEAVCVRS